MRAPSIVRTFAVAWAVVAAGCAPGGGGAGDGGGELLDWPTELLSEFPAFPELNGRIVSIVDRTGEFPGYDVFVDLKYRKPDPVLPVMQVYMERLVAAGFFYGAGSETRDGSFPIDLVYCGTRGQFDMCELNQGGVELGQFQSTSDDAVIWFTWTYDP